MTIKYSIIRDTVENYFAELDKVNAYHAKYAIIKAEADPDYLSKLIYSDVIKILDYLLDDLIDGCMTAEEYRHEVFYLCEMFEQQKQYGDVYNEQE